MNLTDSIKSIAHLTKKIGDIELNTKIIELQSDVFELLEENHNLTKKLEGYENLFGVSENLIVKGHFYYKSLDDTEDGPFCTSCWDSNKKLIRCHISNSMGFDNARCPVCNFASSYLEK